MTVPLCGDDLVSNISMNFLWYVMTVFLENGPLCAAMTASVASRGFRDRVAHERTCNYIPLNSIIKCSKLGNEWIYSVYLNVYLSFYFLTIVFLVRKYLRMIVYLLSFFLSIIISICLYAWHNACLIVYLCVWLSLSFLFCQFLRFF